MAIMSKPMSFSMMVKPIGVSLNFQTSKPVGVFTSAQHYFKFVQSNTIQGSKRKEVKNAELCY